MTDNQKSQDKAVKIILIIFIPIIIFLVIKKIMREESTDHISKKYLEYYNYSFKGVVFEKKQDQRGNGANIAKYLHLNSGIIHRVGSHIYYDIEKGDSVYKKMKSDTVYYITKKKGLIKQMENNYQKDYLKTKSRKH